MQKEMLDNNLDLLNTKDILYNKIYMKIPQ